VRRATQSHTGNIAGVQWEPYAKQNGGLDIAEPAVNALRKRDVAALT
jgi:hypothetical protein